MTTAERPIVVVGAGIMGLATALLLQEESGRDVILVEAGTVGSGTTPAGAGFVAPWAATNPHLGPTGMSLVREGLRFYRGLAEGGADIAFRGNGNIAFYNTTDTLKAGLALMRTGIDYQREVREVSAKEIADLTSGALDPSTIAGGVFMRGGIQLETGSVIDHLAETFRGRGGEIREGVAVHSVLVEDGRTVGLELSRGPVDTDTVVLAAGAWLNELLATAGWSLPLLPFVATRLVTEDVGLPATMPTLQGKDFPLWIRESEGGFTWGTGVGYGPLHRLDPASNSHRREDRTVQSLLSAQHADTERIARIFPALSGAATIREIQGMPVYTADHQFCIGEVPTSAGLWAVGGDNESGVSHGPGLARLIVDLILGKDPLCDPSTYRLDRFNSGEFADTADVERFLSTQDGWFGERLRAFAPAS